ncbi:hypothetical protein ACFFQW_18965 [Umezawaea endophytica]|uniref:Uncharacterized protein n=1 Tax=Umezawaea endophytica TaxID=1654476 RepID=A0A9X3AG99_9PSEU|nr:hypothetical protein [Umezawaea endophytica]MCS7479852.1 hypothetical protein [Umezawaea endophytica]
MSGKTVVELDIFSGRPNPTWTLPDAEATAFRERLDALAGTASGQVANNLGYRGFVVRTGDEVVTVQRGLVRRADGGTTTYGTDPNRDLEQWLLDSGKSSLDPDLVTTVEHELGG